MLYFIVSLLHSLLVIIWTYVKLALDTIYHIDASTNHSEWIDSPFISVENKA